MMPSTSRIMITTCPVSASAFSNSAVCPSCQGCHLPSICVVGFRGSNIMVAPFHILFNYPHKHQVSIIEPLAYMVIYMFGLLKHCIRVSKTSFSNGVHPHCEVSIKLCTSLVSGTNK